MLQVFPLMSLAMQILNTWLPWMPRWVAGTAAPRGRQAAELAGCRSASSRSCSHSADSKRGAS